MATFAADQIISTAGGDDNGDFDFTGLTPGQYRFSIRGTWGSRTIAVRDFDRSANVQTLNDEDGTAMSALSADKTVVLTLVANLRLTMAGTGTALLTPTLTKIF